MHNDKNQTREYVEAVPGPAFVISRETYNKMQAESNSKQHRDVTQKNAKLFEKIIDKTTDLEEDEVTL